MRITYAQYMAKSWPTWVVVCFIKRVNDSSNVSRITKVGYLTYATMFSMTGKFTHISSTSMSIQFFRLRNTVLKIKFNTNLPHKIAVFIERGHDFHRLKPPFCHKRSINHKHRVVLHKNSYKIEKTIQYVTDRISSFKCQYIYFKKVYIFKLLKVYYY